MELVIPIIPPRPVATDSFADITAVVCTDVTMDDNLGCVLTFESDLTVEEQLRVRARVAAKDQEQENLFINGYQALARNDTYRTNTGPSVVSGADAIINSATASAVNKQLAQGIKANAQYNMDLAAQNNALIRLQLQSYGAL